jgi:uncharacterized protein YceK
MVLTLSALATLPGCCVWYSACTVGQLVQGRGKEALYAGTNYQCSDAKRIIYGCLPFGILWCIDLPLTAFTDTMLAPFAWIPVSPKVLPEPEPAVGAIDPVDCKLCR